MKTALWIVGEPGVGKTSLARRLLIQPGTVRTIDKPKWTVGDSICAAGHYKGGPFDGADTVPYNGVEQALQYWAMQLRDRSLTIFDGDRFSYSKVWLTVTTAVERVCCILLVGDESIIRARREARSKQNEVWVKGRRTKAALFSRLFEDRVTINADLGEEIVFQEAINFLSETPRREEVQPAQTTMFPF